MSVLVIGTGAIGQRHAGNLQALGESVTAYSWRSGGLDGLRDVINNSDFEAAVVATATDIRIDVLKVTTDAGLPVYLEKPVAFRQNDLATIETTLGALAERSFAGFMMRYHPAVQFLASEDLSGLFRFDLEIGHDVHQWRKDWSFADSYAANAEGGGVLLDLCHEIDIAHQIAPQAKILSVTSLDHPDHQNVDFATTIDLTTKAGIGRVAMDYLAPASKRSTRLRTMRYCYDFDFVQNAYSVTDGADDRLLDLAIDRQEMFRSAMGDFLRLVRTGDTENPIAPILSRCHSVNTAICRAWETRNFIGSVEGSK